MTIMWANAQMPASCPRSLTTLHSIRKLSLTTPPQACSWFQKSARIDIPYARNSECVRSEFCNSAWPTLSTNDVAVNSPRLSSISAITSGRFSYSSVKDSHSSPPPFANLGVSFLRESTDHSAKSAKWAYLDARNSSFSCCFLPAVSILCSRWIASRCQGSEQDYGSEREKETTLHARTLLGDAGPATSSISFDRDLAQMKSESEEMESGKRKLYASRDNPRVNFGSDQVSRNEDSSVGALGGNEDGNEGRDLKRAAFELWAVEKLKEDGPSALPTIEEMRQTYAPGSPRLDPQVALSEIKSQRNVGLERNNQAGDGSFVLDSAISELRSTGTGSEGVRSLAGVQRRLQANGGDTSQSESVARSRFESWSPKWTTISRGRSEWKGTSRKGVQFSTGGSGTVSGERNTVCRSDASDPQPLLVKRRTKFPVNWNEREGTVMLVDKPQGWTSFAVCAKLRYLLKIQKVGHAGTLDPMATGLLIVCLGKATKLADSYQAMTKVYSGTIRLGELTPSLDAFTEVSAVLPWQHITDEELQQAKQDFIGDIFQTPPMYSAIKVDGERLYKKARRGEEVEIPPRLVTVTEFQLKRSSENRQDVHFKITCSKGTYVRSLCADLARALGSCAHLTVLRREKIGTYSVKDAWPILEFMEQYSQTTNNIVIKAQA